jgi:polysaccharide biosynthesis/export protein ExoF
MFTLVQFACRAAAGRFMKTWWKTAGWTALVVATLPRCSSLAEDQKARASNNVPESALCSHDDTKGTRFRPGDRIELTEYERLDPDPNDRAPGKPGYPSFRLRPEVSGDFDVAEDGTITVPILGQFPAAGKTVEQLRTAVSATFESTLGHAGLITIAIAERQPIYVDGVVKNPGAYKYSPGLTAFHAVSLAGGYQDIKLESHEILLQTMQEAETVEQVKQTLERLLAREAVLKAELNSTQVSPPAALLDIAGQDHAKELISAQLAERRTVLESNATQEREQTQLINSAKQALDVRTNQVTLVDSAIQQRGARLKNLESMMSRGLTSEFMFETAQAEYMDTMSRKQDVAVGIQQSHDQLNNAQAALDKLKLDARFAIQKEVSDLELQIAQQSVVYRAHLATVGIIDADPNLSPGSTQLVYELVRRIDGGVATALIKGLCLLQPGDLIRVYLPSGKTPEDVVAK